MSKQLRCPHCEASLRVPDKVLGQTIRCPECRSPIPTEAPADDAFEADGPADPPPPPPVQLEEVAEDEDRPADTEPVRRKRKRKKKSQGLLARIGLPAIAVDERIVRALVALVVIALVVTGGYFGLRAAFHVAPPPPIPDDQWQTLEVPNRCKVLLPGTPKRETQTVAGDMVMVMQTVSLDKYSFYGIGYSETLLPPARRDLPAEQLLNDACDGSLANTAAMGTRELKRESIQLGPYPGKQQIMDVPRGSGKAISRCYLAHNRVYIVLCGGAGFEPSQKNVRKLLDSFEILDDGSPPAAPPAAVAQRPPVPPPAAAPEVKTAAEPPAKPPEPPPVVRLELPPLPDAIPIKASPVTAETACKLPEPASALRVGGGGRFLVLHLPKLRQLGVFDASEAKIVRYLPVAEDDVFFAAGMTKLVVYLPGSKVIQRYDLLTGEREHVGKLDLPDGKVEAFCMGHASAGPLLVSAAGAARLFDIDKFAGIALPSDEQYAARRGTMPRRLGGGLYWAGATGRVFGHTGNGGQPNGIGMVVLEGGQVREYGQHLSTFFVMPGPDDRHVYAGGHGIVSERVTPLPNVAFSMGTGSGYANHLYLPAAHGPFYLHAMTLGDLGGSGDTTPVGAIRLFVLGDKKPIAVYEKTVVARYGWDGLRGFGVEHSVHLIPRAKLLVVVPPSRDELHLYPADLDAALDKSGRDYLLVTSSPPATFRRGQTFRYEVEARAKKGPVTFKLESAPKEMTVDAKGVITWAVPADFADKRVDVILAARDAGGQEVFQTFTLTDSRGE